MTIEQVLLAEIKQFSIIDAHEHLPPEKVRLQQKVDVFTLFSHYTKVDLLAAGMQHDGSLWSRFRIHDPAIPIEKRWKMFAPFFKHIRFGSYARPAFISAKTFYGVNDINRDNYKILSERIAAFNTPGIYDRILRGKCHIRIALTHTTRFDYDSDLIAPLMSIDKYAAVYSKEIVDRRASELGEKVSSLDDYTTLIRKGLENWKSKGVVGVKMISNPYTPSLRSKAKKVFDSLMVKGGKIELNQWPLTPISPSNHLYSFLVDETLNAASEVGLVVAVHTGMWGDFRLMDPQHMIPIFQRHPKTKFDVYHMGIPYVRETAIIGKNFPNVWLNLCWCHIISPTIACQAMDELIDLVPVNKVIAFGGDYSLPVEKVYGHLVMARENIAKVLGKRVKDNLLSENEAVEIAERWFINNPRELYQLEF